MNPRKRQVMHFTPRGESGAYVQLPRQVNRLLPKPQFEMYMGMTSREEPTILRVDATRLSPLEFYIHFVVPRRPVILCNLAKTDDFARLSLWSNDYLKRVAGDKILAIEHRHKPQGMFGRDAPREAFPFGTFIDQMEQHQDESRYLTSQTTNYEGNALPDLLAEPLLSLKEDFPIRPTLLGNLIPYQCNFWMGHATKGSSSGLHHDYHDNLYYLARGCKVFNISSPDNLPHLFVQGKKVIIHPNGLIVYTTCPTIDEIGTSAFDRYVTAVEGAEHMSQWEKLINLVSVTHQRQIEHQSVETPHLTYAEMDLLLSTQIPTTLRPFCGPKSREEVIPSELFETEYLTLLNDDNRPLYLRSLTKDVCDLILQRVLFWLDVFVAEQLEHAPEFAQAYAEEKSAAKKSAQKRLRGAWGENGEGSDGDDNNASLFGNAQNWDDSDDDFNDVTVFDDDFFEDLAGADDDDDDDDIRHVPNKPAKQKQQQQPQPNVNPPSNTKQQDDEVLPHFSRHSLDVFYALNPLYPPTHDELHDHYSRISRGFPQACLPDQSLYNMLRDIVVSNSMSTEEAEAKRKTSAFRTITRTAKSTVLLLPGEALYLPASFFHEVRSFNLPPKSAFSAEQLKHISPDFFSPKFSGHLALNYWFFPPCAEGVTPANEEKDVDPRYPNFENPYAHIHWQLLWAKTYAKQFRLTFIPRSAARALVPSAKTPLPDDDQ